MTNTITKVELAKWHKDSEPMPESAKATLYGHLVQYAMPLLERFHSDLYHDANWVKSFVTTETVFYYSVDNSGTMIGEDKDIIFRHRKGLNLQVSITNENQVWFATFVDMT